MTHWLRAWSEIFRVMADAGELVWWRMLLIRTIGLTVWFGFTVVLSLGGFLLANWLLR